MTPKIMELLRLAESEAFPLQLPGFNLRSWEMVGLTAGLRHHLSTTLCSPSPWGNAWEIQKYLQYCLRRACFSGPHHSERKMDLSDLCFLLPEVNLERPQVLCEPQERCWLIIIIRGRDIASFNCRARTLKNAVK